MTEPYITYDAQSKKDKWNRGLDLFIESVHKPDHELRQAAHDQRCYTELMDVRDTVLEYLNTIRWH
jgi:hypothetical protein